MQIHIPFCMMYADHTRITSRVYKTLAMDRTKHGFERLWLMYEAAEQCDLLDPYTFSDDWMEKHVSSALAYVDAIVAISAKCGGERCMHDIDNIFHQYQRDGNVEARDIALSRTMGGLSVRSLQQYKYSPK